MKRRERHLKTRAWQRLFGHARCRVERLPLPGARLRKRHRGFHVGSTTKRTARHRTRSLPTMVESYEVSKRINMVGLCACSICGGREILGRRAGHNHLDQEGGAEYATGNKCNQRWARRRAGISRRTRDGLSTVPVPNQRRARPILRRPTPRETMWHPGSLRWRMWRRAQESSTKSASNSSSWASLSSVTMSDMCRSECHHARSSPKQPRPESDIDYGEARRDGVIVKSAPPLFAAPSVARSTEKWWSIGFATTQGRRSTSIVATSRGWTKDRARSTLRAAATLMIRLA